MKIEAKYGPVLLEAIEELLYKIALEMESMKGGPMTDERKKLSKKQEELEELQHQISMQIQNKK